MLLASLPLALCLTVVAAQDTASAFVPARPPAIPLAVRSPYLSTWQNAGSDYGNGGYLAGQWPQHWSQQTTGWSGLVRVDGDVYQWMGVPSQSVGKNSSTDFSINTSIPNVQQTKFEYTSTKSIFTMDVGGKVQMVITFMSPINTDDFKRQSLTMSYMEVEVSSLDGAEHSTQVYTDISAEWASGDRDAVAQWEYGTADGVAYHKVWRQIQIEFDENNKPSGNGMANWGYVYWATDVTDALSVQSGADYMVRTQFANNGTLNGYQDTNFRAINDSSPVFGFALDFSNCGTKPTSATFTIGLLQENAVQYITTDGIIPLASWWTQYFSSQVDALTFFHKDYQTQVGINNQVDDKVKQDSTSTAGDNYNTITSLSVRQAWGATQLVQRSGNQPYLFMKEISSNGNTQTVDVFFPMHPIVLYFNPALLKLLMDPLFEYQEAGLYPNKWSIHDIGTHYPNATGHPDGNDEAMPVEECGNMLIMSLAYAQRMSDTAFLAQHYPILTQWTEFLVNDSLIPANQLSTDDFAGRLANQTNLALKGIVGIRAMGEIARLTGNTTDSDRYNSIAYDYVNQWMGFGIAANATPPHTTLQYGNETSWGLLYNLWGDLELGLNLVPQSVYDMQSNFYPTVKEPYGVPLDTRHTYTKSDWEMFTAAYCSVETRDVFINDLANWIDKTTTGKAFTDLYDTITGDYPGFEFVARPVVGGHFALLIANAQMQNGGKCGSCQDPPPDVRGRFAPWMADMDQPMNGRWSVWPPPQPDNMHHQPPHDGDWSYPGTDDMGRDPSDYSSRGWQGGQHGGGNWGHPPKVRRAISWNA